MPLRRAVYVPAQDMAIPQVTVWPMAIVTDPPLVVADGDTSVREPVGFVQSVVLVPVSIEEF